MNGILTDETGDLPIKVRRSGGKISGGLVIGDVRADVAERILIAYPGEFKEKPQLGCNLRETINGAADPFFRGNAMAQLKSEGIDVERLNINADNLELVLKS